MWWFYVITYHQSCLDVKPVISRHLIGISVVLPGRRRHACGFVGDTSIVHYFNSTELCCAAPGCIEHNRADMCTWYTAQDKQDLFFMDTLVVHNVALYQWSGAQGSSWHSQRIDTKVVHNAAQSVRVGLRRDPCHNVMSYHVSWEKDSKVQSSRGAPMLKLFHTGFQQREV